MTREGIILMARMAGWPHAWMDAERLERFFQAAYAAGAAAEQKKWQDQTMVDIHEAVLEEREACAKVADRHSTCKNDTPDVIAVAIRARGQS